MENFPLSVQGETTYCYLKQRFRLFFDKKLHKKLIRKFGSKEQSHHNSDPMKNSKRAGVGKHLINEILFTFYLTFELRKKSY
jgi:hypothetical protein